MSDVPAPSSPAEGRWLTALTVAAITAAALLRTVDLVGLPGEMYGDIAIVHEYVEDIGHGKWPTGFVLSSGPLYHYLIMPVVWVLGSGFTALKIAAVIVSLVTLLTVYALARDLLDRRLGVVSLFIAGVSSWLLVFSRLGNSQILTPLLATGALWFAVRTARSVRWWDPAACAVVATAGLYSYPQTFILAPAMLIVLVLLVWTHVGVRWRDVRVFTGTALLVAIPFVDIVRDAPGNFFDGYIGGKLHSSSGVLATLFHNTVDAMLAWHVTGDSVFRSNPDRLPHLDPLSGLLFLAGVGYWLTGTRRRWAPVVLAPLVLFQIPSIMVLAHTAEVPSASRTLLVAPLAAVVTASGICWVVDATHRSSSVRRILTGFVLALVLVLNAQRYFGTYADGLPNHNVAFGRHIADFFGTLPQGTHAFTVGCCWGEHGQPEPKGITYLGANRVADGMVELSRDTFDCAAMSRLPRPAVLVWSPENPLPSEHLGDCAGELEPVVHVQEGTRVFTSSLLGDA